jgi:hypothetical protein
VLVVETTLVCLCQHAIIVTLRELIVGVWIEHVVAYLLDSSCARRHDL